MRRASAIISLFIAGSVLSGCTLLDTEVPSRSSGGHSSAPTSTASAEPDPGAAAPGTPETAPTDPVEEIPVSPETTADLAIESEVAFLEAARSQWEGDQIPDPALLGLGNDACSELEAGKSESDIGVILEDSGIPVENNAAIVAAASAHLCPPGG